MKLAKLSRNGQLTLPASVRAALRVQDGDYLEAELVENGVLLRPVAAGEREKA
jgi:AbrB family looped-hinge helix DNA binding protein